MFAQTTTHASLLARLADGQDPAAWREFHQRYGELIRGFARRQNLQPADCDDVAQDVLLALSKAMPSFRYDPAKGKFRSYLKTVVLHAIFKRSKHKPGEVNLEYIEEATRAATEDKDIEGIWEEEWRQYHIRLARRRIELEFSEADRAAFEAYALGGRDARETAQALGMSVDQVYQAKSRILKRLSELIDQQVADEG
jgi:RNA polymerase sigma-70 factor (ECF subfamily)